MRNYQYGSAINKGVNCTKIELSQQYFPNENIYKMDSEYTMKPTLSFVNSREQICKRNILLRYIDLIKIMIAYACVKNVYLIFEEWGEISILLTFLRIPVIFILLITGLMVINIDKFINNTSYVRIFLEFEILLNILIEMKKDKTCYDHSSYSFILILMKYIKGFIYNFCFCLTTDESLISYSIESIVILSFIGDQNRFFLSRLITNLCSMKLIYTVIHVFITLGIQSQLVLGQRELWAMYDSFKRSYNTIKTIYDEFGIPVFIVKKNGLRIYYRNTEADKLLRKRSTKIGFNQPTRLTSRRTGLKHDITLKDVFDKSDLLEYEISKCLKRGLKQFDFPINTRNKDLLLQETENCPTMYEGDVECVDWVKVHLCECQWKENEALMIQIFPNNNNLKNNILLVNESVKDLSVIVENLNSICHKAPELEKSNQISLKCSVTNIIKAKQMTFSPSKKGYGNNSLLKYAGKPLLNKSEAPGALLTPKPLQSSIIKLRNDTNLNEPHTHSKIIRTAFDYTTLYLMKNNFNYIYDQLLCAQIFSSLRVQNVYMHLTKFNFENFLRHMIYYLYPVSKMKKFKISYETELSEDILAIYEYIRVIIFSIFTFIINNTRSVKKEKNLLLKVEHNSYSTAYGSYYKFSFIFKDDDTIIPYNKLSEILMSLDCTSLSMTDLDKYRIIDIGLIASYFICCNIYNAPEPKATSLSIKSENNNHEIIASIYVPAKRDAHSNHGRALEEKKFTNIKTILYEEKYYNKIIERIYLPNLDSYPQYIRSPGGRRKFIRKTVDKHSYKNYVHGKNDENLNDDWEKAFLRDDISLCREMKLQKLKIDEHKNLTSLSVLENKIKFVQRINYNIVQREKHFFKWDNSAMKSNIIYCKVPRFLVVEDNPLGRLSITEELKKTKLKYMLDFASDGTEAVEKFKILLNQGYMFDFIFMDIYLREMSGYEATKIMRATEEEYNVHTNIACVTVEGRNEIETGIFDDYFEKPIKNCERLNNYIAKHFKLNRPEISL